MSGLPLVTKGMLSRSNIIVQGGGGGAGLQHREEDNKPIIKVQSVKFVNGKKSINEIITIKSIK